MLVDLKTLKIGDTVQAQFVWEGNTNSFGLDKYVLSGVWNPRGSFNFSYVLPEHVTAIIPAPLPIKVGTEFKSSTGIREWVVIHIIDDEAWCRSDSGRNEVFTLGYVRERLKVQNGI